MNDATERIEEARPRRFRRYPEYKDSGIEWVGEIPAHWEVMRLGFNATFVVPMRDKPEDLSGEVFRGSESRTLTGNASANPRAGRESLPVPSRT